MRDVDGGRQGPPRQTGSQHEIPDGIDREVTGPRVQRLRRQWIGDLEKSIAFDRHIQIVSSLLKSALFVVGLYAGDPRPQPDAGSRGGLLAILLDITESGYGFVGEVVGEGDGVNPWLRTWAMTDISWDAQSRALYEQSGQEGVMEFVNTELIFAFIESHMRGGARVDLPLEGSTIRLQRGIAPKQPKYQTPA